MRKIKISVIIPIYKVEKYLEKCITSVITQTYDNLEIILVDDGSPDKCPQMCDEYAKKCKNIQVVHKRNGGLSSARNYGVKQATGEYVLFLDSDDYWDDKNAVNNIVNALEKDTDVLFFRYKKQIEVTGRIFCAMPEINPQKLKTLQTKEDFCEYLMHEGLFFASACNKLVRRKLLTENNIDFREGVTSEDIEWCGKLLLKSQKMAYVNECFYVYRQRGDSITTSMSMRNIRDLKNNIIYSIQNAETEILKESKLYEIYMSYMAYQYATYLLCVHNVKEKGIYRETLSMKKYACILDYSKNKKVIWFRRIYKITGFRGLYCIAGIYMKFLYNKH